MSGYSYQALDRSRREIRLIVLKDSRRTAKATDSLETPLRCSMVTTSLGLYKDPPWHYLLPVNEFNQIRNAFARTFLPGQPFSKDFYALSYVWGDPAAVCNIDIDGTSVKISANLYAALQSIRSNTKFRVLWVDALCINQSDLEEKSWQVQQMATIYSRAQATISWLGPQSADSELALRSLTELDVSTNDSYWSIQQSREGVLPPKKVKKAILRITEDRNRWNAIANLCARPYWTRIWIFQEMAHGQQCYFLCGDCVTTRTWRPISLLIAWQATRAETPREIFGPQCSAMVDSMLTLRFHGNHPTEPHYYIRSGTLHEMLLKLGSLKATELRDKIYAPLCIATDRDQLGIIPDYSKSLEVIFTETACALARTGSLGFLVTAASQNIKNLELPSWVPDWSIEVNDDFDRMHRADRGQFQRSPTLQDIPPLSDHITLDRYSIGKVVWVHARCPSAALNPRPIGSETPLNFSEWLDRLEVAIASAESEDNNQDSKSRSSKDSRFTLVELLCGILGGQAVSSSTATTYLQVYRALKSALSLESLRPNDSAHSTNEELTTYVNHAHKNLANGSRPFLTESGAVGISQKDDTIVGDEIVLIPGVSVPCVLRSLDDENKNYRLMSDAYVHGIMDGEFFSTARKKRDCVLQVQPFTLY